MAAVNRGMVARRPTRELAQMLPIAARYRWIPDRPRHWSGSAAQLVRAARQENAPTCGVGALFVYAGVTRGRYRCHKRVGQTDEPLRTRARGLLLRIGAMLTAMVSKTSGSGSGHLRALSSGSNPALENAPQFLGVDSRRRSSGCRRRGRLIALPLGGFNLLTNLIHIQRLHLLDQVVECGFWQHPRL